MHQTEILFIRSSCDLNNNTADLREDSDSEQDFHDCLLVCVLDLLTCNVFVLVAILTADFFSPRNQLHKTFFFPFENGVQRYPPPPPFSVFASFIYHQILLHVQQDLTCTVESPETGLVRLKFALDKMGLKFPLLTFFVALDKCSKERRNGPLLMR